MYKKIYYETIIKNINIKQKKIIVFFIRYSINRYHDFYLEQEDFLNRNLTKNKILKV